MQLGMIGLGRMGANIARRLMRQIDRSEWLTNPDVVKVETTDQGPARQARFIVTLKQKRHGDEAGMEDAG